MSDQLTPIRRVVVSVELDELEAMALAQFVKRVTWGDMRGCAVDNDECEAIRDAIIDLQNALAEAGYAPR